MHAAHSWLSLIAFLLITCLLLHLINIFCVKTDTSRYLMLDELRNSNDIDILFVGSSPIYYGIDPAIIQSETGMKAFDAAVGNAGLEGVLALTELAFESNHPKYVICALEPDMLLSLQESEEAEVRIMPMLSPKTAVHYLSELLYSDNRFLARLFYFRFMPVDSPDDLFKSIRIRFNPAPYIEEMNQLLTDTPYRGSGYHEMLLQPPDGGLFSTRLRIPSSDVLDEFPQLTKDRILRLQALCKKNSAQFLLSILPLPAPSILSSLKTMQVCDILEEFCANHSISFINASRAKPDWLPDLDQYFVDIYHLNAEGASIFSRSMSSLIQQMELGASPASFQFSSWNDYLDHSKRIFSVYAVMENSHDFCAVTAGCICGTDIMPYYKFDQVLEDGTMETLQDWSTDNVYSFEAGSNFHSTIAVRAALDAEGNGEMYYLLSGTP